MDTFINGTTAGETIDGSYTTVDTFDGKGAPAGSEDLIFGHTLQDTFIYQLGYGKLRIWETPYAYGGQGGPLTATLKLGAGIAASSVLVKADQYGDLTLTDGLANDSIQLNNEFRGFGVAQVVFADGTVWDKAKLMALANTGTTGADFLFGTADAQTFDGGGAPAGTQDVVIGGGGHDTFVFNVGYGQLEINEQEPSLGYPTYAQAPTTATLAFGAGIAPSQIAVSADASGAVYLTDGVSGDRVKLDGFTTAGDSFGVAHVTFADGTVWDRSAIIGHATTGTAAADTLYGADTADTFDGKGAPAGLQDYEQGNGGADTFVYQAGYGGLEINEAESGYTTASTATLQLGAGISLANLTFRTDASGALSITDGVAGDLIRIDNMMNVSFYGVPQNGVAKVLFSDGTTLGLTQIIALANQGTSGADYLYGTTNPEVLDGGGAPVGFQDVVVGGGGADVFVYNRGYGRLEINAQEPASPVTGQRLATSATLRFGAGITPDQVGITTDGSGALNITDGTAADLIKVDYQGVAGDYRGLAKIAFSDGTVWDQATIQARLTKGTVGADSLVGTSGADVFDGKGAPAGLLDYEQGNGGADTFIFKSGYGHLEINETEHYPTGSPVTSVLQLGAGITSSQITIVSDYSGNVTLTDGLAGDQVTIDGQNARFNSTGGTDTGVAQIRFADGTIWSRQHIIDLTTSGTSAAETLYGTFGSETFDGKGAPAGGQDREDGNGGSDTFIYKMGYGNLLIVQSSLNTDGSVLQFGPGITAGQITVTSDEYYSLNIRDGIAGDQISVSRGMHGFDGTYSYGIGAATFADGTSLTRQQLAHLATTGTAGGDRLFGTDYTYYASGADTFDGKGAPAGTTDYEQGNGGADTFIYNVGYGQLEINENSGYGPTSSSGVLRYGAGISATQVTASSDASGNVFLTDGTLGDRVQIDGMTSLDYYGGVNRGVLQVTFADGTTWNRQHVIDLATTGSLEADNLYGTVQADTFDGKGAPAGGQDYEQGNGGADTFIYQSGYGHLEINSFAYGASATATLQLGAGLTSSQVLVAADASGNLIVTDGVAGDLVQIDAMLRVDYSGGSPDGVAQLRFADGTVWDRSTLLSKALAGTTGGDQIYDGGGANVFDGLGAPVASQDYVRGGGGADTFVFNPGYGALEIDEADQFRPSTAVLKLGAGISAVTVVVTKDASNNVYLTDGLTGDQVKIDNQSYNDYHGVKAVQFSDGTSWTRATLLANAAASATAGLTSPNALYFYTGEGSATASLTGDLGVVNFSRGDGNVVVNVQGGTGIVQFGPGITASNVVFNTDGSGNLSISLAGSPQDSLLLTGDLSLVGGRTSAQITQARFADGSTLPLGNNLTQKVAASSVIAPSSALAGQVVPITWTFTNTGAVPAIGPWTEQLFLAADAAGTSLQALGVYSFAGSLDVGQSTTQTVNVTLPISLSGNSWIVVRTGATGQAVSSAPVVVTAAAVPNLVVTNVAAPTAAFSGQPTQLTWTVTNSGPAGTGAAAWYDNVYLSLDSVLDEATQSGFPGTNTDLLLASAPNPSYLATGQSYTSTLSVVLPQQVSGPYHIIVRADAGKQVYQGPSTATTYLSSNAFTVTASPVADLTVSKVIAPPNAFSGQPLMVNWTVKNTGSIATPVSAWTDQVLVSFNGVLDAASVSLGTLAHTGAVAADGSYTGSTTVTLPIGVAGTATFFVVADYRQAIYEGALRGNSTASSVAPTSVAITPPPDLVATMTSTPLNAAAGHALSFSYSVANNGATITPNTSWTDNVYLSKSATLDGTALLLRSINHYGALDVGQSYVVSDSAVLSTTVSGPYYLLVQADAGQQVFELNHGNDTVASSAFPVSNAAPNLVVSQLTAPATGQSGHQVTVTWKVTNSGTGDTAASTWSDTVVVSPSGALGATDNVVVATISGPASTLAAGASYSRSAAVNLPLALKGSYTLFVVTDPDPRVPLSSLAQGASVSQAIAISQQLADLQVASVTVPATAIAGQPITLSWKVTNAGTGPTDATSWVDNIYASTVQGSAGTLGTLVGQVTRVNPLLAGAVYTASATITLPSALAGGNYYFVVKTDAQQQVTESAYLDDTGTSAAVAIAAAPVVIPPALVVSSVVVPVEAVSGQTLAVSYTVTNNGGPAQSGWNDTVYLSRNQVHGASDIYLGYVNNTGLAAGASQTNTQSFAIPAGQNGPFQVIVVADAGGAFPGDANGGGSFAVSSATKVDLPAVVNLQVGGVTPPAAAVAGAQATFGYTVNNLSDNAEQGSWYDAFYLSTNSTWDASNPLIGKVQHTGGVAAHGSYSGSLTALVPGVVPGNYEVIVRTNILGEAPGTNATGASGSTVAVGVPTLAFGTPVTGSLTTGQQRYYQFTVAAGQTVDLAVTSDNPTSINNVYARFGALPTFGQFDATSSNPSTSNPDALIKVTQPGTYYVLVAGNSVAGSENVTVTATELGFTLSHITPDHGSNLGSVTLTLDGAKFNANEVVQVVASDGTARTATTVRWANSTELWATFDLRGLATGAYTVKVGDATQSASLANAFTVNNGPLGQASVNLVVPQYLRAGQTGVVQIEYANTGQTDIAAPVINLSSAQALLTGAGITGSTGEVTFVGTNPNGPAGILQPGATGSASFSYTPINPQPHEQIEFIAGVLPTAAPVAVGGQAPTASVDWAGLWSGLETSSRPATVGTADWHNVWNAFRSVVGTTSASVTNALSKAATELSQVGQPTSDIATLLQFELLQATGALAGTALSTATDIAATGSSLSLSLGRSYGGTLLDRNAAGLFGNGWTSTYDVSAVTDASGNVSVRSQGTLHVFTLGANGTYAAATGDASTLTASGGLYQMRTIAGVVEAFRADGKLASITDAHGNVDSLAYNSFGVLQKVASSATGESITFTSNVQGRITSAVDSDGQQVSYAYDATGTQLLSATASAGVTSYTYAAPSGTAQDNALLSVTNPDGTGSVFTYGAQGWLGSQSAIDGSRRITYTYDGAGRVATTDALGRATVKLYGANGAVAQTQDALGNVTQVQSGAYGQTTSAVSAGGSSLSARYDAAGNLIGYTDPLNGTVSAAYAPGTSNLTGLTTQLGSQTHYTYDSAGDVTGITYQDGNGATYHYATNGLLTSSTDANGATTAYGYDKAGNLTGRAFADGTAYAYTYDVRGNLLTATAPSGTTTYTYDLANRLLSVTDAAKRVESYGYNAKGQLSSRTEPDGSVTQYGYTARGQLATLQDGSGNLLTKYTYDAAGQLTGRVTGNGASTAYQYDAAGRTTEILDLNADGSVADRLDYEYDANSQVVQQATTDGTWTYGYDAAGQLTGAAFASTNPGVASQSLSYTYDAAGNRVSQTVNGVTTAYAVNALNQYTQVGETNYTYDANGRTIAKTDSSGTTTIGYDIDGHLTSESGPGGSFAYAYDALGNLVSKSENGTVKSFVNDPLSMSVGGQPLTSVAQAYSATGSVQATYDYGLGLTSVSSSAGASYVNTDLTGNIVGWSGESGGLSASSIYEPFGQVIKTSVNSSFLPGFSGLYGVLASANLDFMRSRAYDPFLGRFLTADPIGLAGGTNLYRFAVNSPLQFTDPTGHQAAGQAVDMSQYRSPDGYMAEQAGAKNTQDYNSSTPSEQVQGAYFAAQGLLEIGLGGAGIGGGAAAVFTGVGVPAGLFSIYIGTVGVHDGFEKMDKGLSMLISPNDPNEIIGPLSYGIDKLTSGRGSLHYQVLFENASTASASAQSVTVTQHLDNNLDWETFRLTGFGFNNVAYTLLGKAPFYTAQLDLTATKGFVVDISAGVDVATGIVTWRFSTIDPSTGQAPADPTKGFLPVNNAAHIGDGFVSYTVQAKPGIHTGDVVGAQATVIFDNQPPVNTPAITNTLVVDAPTSSVQALAAQTDSTAFQVSWFGQDVSNGPGIAGYTILVSQDGGPATPWLTNTTLTNAVFTGEFGHSYAFSSIAVDNVGIAEAAHSSPDATIVVGHLDPGPTTSPGRLIVGHGQTLDLTSTIAALVSPGLPGDVERVTSATSAAGEASVSSTGAVSYTAPASGNDTVTYAVTDQLGNTATGTIAVTVDAGPALSSVAVAKVGHGQTVRAGTVAPGIAGDTLTLNTTSAGKGTLSLAGSVLTYTAPAAAVADTVGYTVTDQLGDIVAGTFTTKVDGGPATTAGTLVAAHGKAVSFTSLLTSLVTPGLAGDTETITAVSATTGTILLAGSTVSYTAPTSGTDTVTYTVTDQLGETATGTVAVTVDAGPALTAAAVAKVGHGQSVRAGTVAPGISGDVLTLATTATGRGALSLAGGVLTYAAPISGGADSVSYTVTDQIGDTVTGTFTTQVDGGPTTAIGTLAIGHDRTTSLTSLLSGLVTPGLPGDMVTVTAASARSGAAVLTGGTVAYTAPASGRDSVTYTVTDQLGDSATGTIAVTVDPGPVLVSAAVAKVGHSQSVQAGTVAPGIAGDTLTFNTTSAGQGTLSLAGGVLTYTAPATAGADSISYTVTDQLGDAVAGTFTTKVDSGPLTAAGTLVAARGKAVSLTNLLASLVTPGLAGDAETITAVAAKTGKAVLLAGAITYTAPASGTDTITYAVTDQLGETATGTIAVTVDTGPTLNTTAVAAVGHDQTARAATVTAGVAGDVLTLATTAAGRGTLSLLGGIVSYAAPAAAGTDSIGYTVTDQFGQAVSGIFSTKVDGGPALAAGSLTIGHGQVKSLTTLLAGLVTPGLTGDIEKVTAVSARTGSAVLVGGATTYTAPASGTDTVSFTVTDQLGDMAGGTVRVTVDAGPTFTAASVVKVGHGQIVQAGNVTPGLTGDILTFATTAAGRGTISLSGGTLRYVAPATAGADSIGYTVTDQLGDSVAGTFSTQVDGGPTARAGTLLVGHGKAANVTALLTGLVTPGLPGDIETVTAVSAKTGKASLTGGVATYTAPASGTDTLTYTVTDQLGETSSSTVAITVDAGPAVAVATVAKVGHGQAVRAGTVTAGFAGDTLTLATTTAGQGALSLASGVLTYTAPATGGADSIGYTVTDQLGDSVAGTFSTQVDGGPTLKAGTLVAGHGKPVTITSLLAGLVTPGLAGDMETLASVSAPNGTTALVAGIATYTAPASGMDTVTYAYTDQLGDTATGTVAVTVDPGPVLTTAIVTKVGHGQSVQAGTVAAGMSGDKLTLSTTTAGRGTLRLAGGVLTYAAPTTAGADSISYNVTDQLGDTVTGTFATTVDRGPAAASGKVTVGHGQTSSLAALISSLIAPGLVGDTETITAVSAKLGIATLAAGAIGYTAPATGTDTVTYTVADQLGEVASGTVAVTVDPGPKVTGITVAKVGHGQTVTAATVLPGITGDQVSLATLTAGLGSLSLANGVVSYTAPNTGGPDSIGYQITDQNGDAVRGTFITQVDPGPIAGTLSTACKLGATTDLTSAILAVDKAGLVGDVLSLSGVGTAGTLGTVSFTNGHITYVATGAALTASATHGSTTDSFSYTVRDQLGDSIGGLVTIRVST